MKIMVLSLMLVAGSAWAKPAAFNLQDPAILGQYALVKAEKNSEIQTADLIYNHDNELVLVTDRNDTEYALTGPNAKQVVYDGQDEANCDGDEAACYYDSQTTIRMLPGADGKPQVELEITVSNAWDETGKEDVTTKYILNWSKTLPYQIPFYSNVKAPAELKKLSEGCAVVLQDIALDTETSYLNVNDVCPYSSSFKYRGLFDEAFEYLKTDWTGNNKDKVKELTPAAIKSDVFAPAKALAAKYKASKGSVTAAQIAQQLDLVEAYVLKADRVFSEPDYRGIALFVVNSKTKVISHFSVRTSNH